MLQSTAKLLMPPVIGSEPESSDLSRKGPCDSACGLSVFDMFVAENCQEPSRGEQSEERRAVLLPWAGVYQGAHWID